MGKLYRSRGLCALVRCCCLVAVFLFCGPDLFSKELPEVLRRASELYRAGQIEEARSLAESYQKGFPKDLEALLLLGRLDFEGKRFAEAKTWFRLASQVNRSHPLVKMYKKLFEELEHRRGPISEEYLPLPGPDKEQVAEKFRRGWFGPSFTSQYDKVGEPPLSEPDSLGVATHSLGIIYGTSVDFQANKALKQGWYLKAFLLYKDLIRSYPENIELRLGAAEAAIGIRKYAEANDHLDKVLLRDPSNQRANDLKGQTVPLLPNETHP